MIASPFIYPSDGAESLSPAGLATTKIGVEDEEIDSR